MTPENALLVGERMRAYNDVETALKGGLSPQFLSRTRQRLGCTVEELSLMLETLQEKRRGELRDLGVTFPCDDAEPEKIRFDMVRPDLAARAPYEAPARQKQPDHLTITLTGPQGCGKTVVARWLRAAIEHWNGGPSEEMTKAFDDCYVAFDDKLVTVVDTGDPMGATTHARPVR